MIGTFFDRSLIRFSILIIIILDGDDILVIAKHLEDIIKTRNLTKHRLEIEEIIRMDYLNYTVASFGKKLVPFELNK